MLQTRVNPAKLVLSGLVLAGILAAGVNHASAQTSSMSGSGTSGGSSSFGSSSGSSSSSFGSGSFTGTGTSFTGGTSSSFSGGTTGAGQGGGGVGGRLGGASGGSGYPGVSTMNPFYAYYANPFAAGLPSTSGLSSTTTARTVAYGTPLYNSTSNSMSAGTASLSGANNQGYPGSNSIGIRRAPTFTTAIAFEITPVKPTAVQTQVQSMLAKSSKILSKDTIIVAVDGDGLVLRGLAKDDHERRLAEALVRLTPGVRNVRNELAVPETAPNPRRVPQ